MFPLYIHTTVFLCMSQMAWPKLRQLIKWVWLIWAIVSFIFHGWREHHKNYKINLHKKCIDTYYYANPWLHCVSRLRSTSVSIVFSYIFYHAGWCNSEHSSKENGLPLSEQLCRTQFWVSITNCQHTKKRCLWKEPNYKRLSSEKHVFIEVRDNPFLKCN